jgi:hypothetical protein
LKASAVITTGLSGFALLPGVAWSSDEDINIIGRKAGYSPQIGTLISMMTWMRAAVLRSVKGLSQKDLDFLLDSKANTIGALLLHRRRRKPTTKMNTFNAKSWGSWPDSVKRKWDTPMGLGEPARKAIQSNDLDYYLTILEETREKSLGEFRKHDDNWLMSVDKQWPWGPTNNYC